MRRGLLGLFDVLINDELRALLPYEDGYDPVTSSQQWAPIAFPTKWLWLAELVLPGFLARATDRRLALPTGDDLRGVLQGAPSPPTTSLPSPPA